MKALIKIFLSKTISPMAATRGRVMNYRIFKYLLIGVFFAITIIATTGCAPTWVHAPAAPDYYATTEPIPIDVGVSIDEPPFAAQWWGESKIRQDYGPEVVDYLKRMRVFKNIIFPYGKNDTADATLFLSIKGHWKYDNKGRALGSFLIGTPNYNDFEGTHDVKVILKVANEEVANYSMTVDTKGQYSGTDTDMITKELNDLQIKKIAIVVANRFNGDRAQIMDRISKTKEQAVRPDTTVQTKGEFSKVNMEKLDKLREDGIISEEEYKRAKSKLTLIQTDNSEVYKQLQELSNLHKNGVLSEEDYNKAKKRLTELQKINEFYKSGILSDEEYTKAKNRLLKK